MMKKTILSFIILLTVSLSCDNNESIEVGPTYDRESILKNWYNQHISIGLSDFKNKVEMVGEMVDLLNNEKTLSSLTKLREEHLKAWKAWQKIEMFNIGKAEEIYYKEKMNIYPVNTARIEANVLSGSYDLANDANNYAAQGFPTLDYLLYGIGSTDEEILSKYIADNTYLNYLKAVSDEMNNNTEKVVNDWETYKNEFTSSTDNTATSAVNLMVNDFIFYYEKGFRANKIGIPAGVFSPAALPFNVEAYHKKNISKTLALEALSAIEKFFKGQSYDLSTDGLGLDTYVNFLDNDLDEEKKFITRTDHKSIVCMLSK